MVGLLAAPLVVPSTVLGVTVALLALIAPTLAELPASLADHPRLGIASLARTAADVTLGLLPWPNGAFGAVLLAAIFVGLLFTGPWPVGRSRTRPYAAAGLGILTLVGAHSQVVCAGHGLGSGLRCRRLGTSWAGACPRVWPPGLVAQGRRRPLACPAANSCCVAAQVALGAFEVC